MTKWTLYISTIAVSLLSSASLSANAQNISFADQTVKTLCVSNWDTDGDSELSQIEASAVTSLGTIFKGKKNITSFEELEYFTGLNTIDDYAFYQSSLQKVLFPNSVTSIGEYAFSETQLGEEIVIPGTVKIIGSYAFSECSKLMRIILEEGVECINSESFTGPIHFMTLPSTITYFAAAGINPYPSTGLSSRDYVFRMLVRSETPVPVKDYAFRRLFGEGILIVPLGATENYKNKNNWTNFYKIEEVGDVNEDGLLDDLDLSAIEDFITNGVSEFNPLQSDVNFDGVTDGKDVEYLKNYIESTTSVSSINLTPADTHVYTIDGRRLPDNITISSLPHGIYISNGRKFVVK